MSKRKSNVHLLVNISTYLMLFLDKRVTTSRGQHNDNMPAYCSSFFLKRKKNGPFKSIFSHLTLYPFRSIQKSKRQENIHMNQSTSTLEAPNFCTDHDERQCFANLIIGAREFLSELLVIVLVMIVSASNSTVICCDTSCTC